MSTLHLSIEHHKQIAAHAEAGYPSEVVGILAGTREGNTVQRVCALENERADTNNRYKVSGLTLYRATQALEKEGFDIVGYYHSHPDHSAQYSDYDREHALPNLSYVIISVQKGTPAEIKSWRLSEDRDSMFEETVNITDKQLL